MKTKICTKCRKEKSIDNFYKRSDVKDGLRSWCKNCQSKEGTIYIKIQRKKYPIKAWCKGTIYGHKKRGYKILFGYKELLPIAKNSMCCSICNDKLSWILKNGTTQSNTPTLDSVDNKKILSLKNIQILCHKCNRTKSNRNMKELYKWCKSFIEKFKQFKEEI